MRVSPLLIALSLPSLWIGCGPGADTTGRDTTTTSTTATQQPPGAHAARARHRAQRVQRAAPAGGPVRFGQQTKTSGCRPRGALPDPGCTPGSIITQATTARICVSGYTQGVRNVPTSLKAGVYAEYGIGAHEAGQYEVDHLVPLELGGSNSIANLWPEVAPGFHKKDAVENELHDAVCSGTIPLRAAQVRIARDWPKAGVRSPAGDSGSGPSNPPPPTSSAAPSHPRSDASFCNTHPCIASFGQGKGTIVQCADGKWSHSGGVPGVCSRHGGPKS